MTFTAAFFDAGLTLLGPHPSFHEIFVDVMREQGHEVSLDEVKTAFDEIGPNFLKVLEGDENTQWSTNLEVSRRFWGLVYARALDSLGIPDPDRELAGKLYGRFTRYESYRLYPDSLPVLKRIKEAGLVLGLISNFEDWLEGMLIEMEVANLFDEMVISGKEGIEKPDPQIFKVALERAGVEASQAIYVGDDPVIDAAGSAAVGMTGILIDRNERHPAHDGPRIRSLEELLPILGITGEPRDTADA